MVAEIIINSIVKTLNRVFDYNIPKELADKIKIGSRVIVPFGNGKKLEDGFVINIKQSSEYKIKDIEKFEEQAFSKENIELAKWMSNRYFCNISDCLKLMLPPGTATKELENRTKEKLINFVYLAKETDEIENAIENKIIKSEKQIRVLKFLEENEEATVSDIEMFTEASRAIVKTLEKNGFVEIVAKEVERNPFIHKNIQRDEKRKLTEEQQLAFNTINKSIIEHKFNEFLIYGVTGSGKTEVYMQLIENILKQEKTAIVLVPEISLTPQMVDRFIARFGEETIAVLHSKLSVGERYDQWNKIRNGDAKIVIGARSAIFAPIKNLGIIIIDEEHDDSYKSEMNPRYNAKDISKIIAKQNNIPLVLGSATPSVDIYYKAKQKEITLIELTKRANNSNLPNVEIVDLRNELAEGNRSMLSRRLYYLIQENIKNKKQTILFLNRRGFSTFIMCRDCGYVAKCPNCNISLTYHRKENMLKCHYCGHTENIIKVCPECKSEKVRYFGTGTQKLEEQVKKYFPEATTIRMDVDTVTKKNSHELIINKFKEESIDILIGTQMVVKGHHFPKVTLVGVIAADSSLNIDNYKASETTFDLLVQVAGRAGREKLPGNVIIQTYNPDNFCVQYAQKQDYNLFYNAEIHLREMLKYPPFCDIIMFGINGNIYKEVVEVSKFLYENLKKYNIEGILLKPMPAPIDKIKKRYRWRMILKTTVTEEIITNINELLNKYYAQNYKNTRVIVDINPNNLS